MQQTKIGVAELNQLKGALITVESGEEGRRIVVQGTVQHFTALGSAYFSVALRSTRWGYGTIEQAHRDDVSWQSSRGSTIVTLTSDVTNEARGVRFGRTSKGVSAIVERS